MSYRAIIDYDDGPSVCHGRVFETYEDAESAAIIWATALDRPGAWRVEHIEETER